MIERDVDEIGFGRRGAPLVRVTPPEATRVVPEITDVTPTEETPPPSPLLLERLHITRRELVIASVLGAGGLAVSILEGHIGFGKGAAHERRAEALERMQAAVEVQREIDAKSQALALSLSVIQHPDGTKVVVYNAKTKVIDPEINGDLVGDYQYAVALEPLPDGMRPPAAVGSMQEVSYKKSQFIWAGVQFFNTETGYPNFAAVRVSTDNFSSFTPGPRARLRVMELNTIYDETGQAFFSLLPNPDDDMAQSNTIVYPGGLINA